MDSAAHKHCVLDEAGALMVAGVWGHSAGIAGIAGHVDRGSGLGLSIK